MEYLYTAPRTKLALSITSEGGQVSKCGYRSSSSRDNEVGAATHVAYRGILSIVHYPACQLN